MSGTRTGGGDLSLLSFAQDVTNDPQADNDEEIKNLYVHLERLLYVLKGTGPQVQSNAPPISRDEIRRVRRAVETRFQMHEHLPETELEQFPQRVQEIDNNGRLQRSNQKLKSLLAKLRGLPACTTRKRVYMTSFFNLPEPALPSPSLQDVATMLVPSHIGSS
jgi:hypothetical protein